MSLWGVLASLVGGFVLLALAANTLVDSSASLARGLGWSPAIVGAFFIGFGTSSPELFVSVVAALKDQPDIALGNALGSNLANSMLIAGAAALFAPLALPRDGRIQAWILLGALAFLSALCWDGDLSVFDGMLLLALFVGAFGLLLFKRGEASPSEEGPQRPERSLRLNLTLALVSPLVLALASELLLSGATEVARYAGISELAIGLTLVAVGTSIPELAAVTLAAFKSQRDLVLGGVLGSNIFNTLLVVGAAVSIAPVTLADEVRQRDLPAQFLVLLLLFVLLRMPPKRFSGWAQAVILFAGFALYQALALGVVPGIFDFRR